VRAHGGEHIAAVGQAAGLDDAGERADVEAAVTAADLAARSMSTTPNSGVPASTTSVMVRYRGSKTCKGNRACGNRTVPSGNIGSTATVISP
jgi:hypothetical protein